MNDYYALYKVRHDRENAERQRHQHELITAATESQPHRRWWRLTIRLRLPSLKPTTPEQPCPDTILSAH
jgi:hypothetical protein